MEVLKFGGTSLGSPERMRAVAELIKGDTKKIVVLSAVAGTTNQLVTLAKYLSKQQAAHAQEKIEQLSQTYQRFIDELYASTAMKQKANELLNVILQVLQSALSQNFDPALEKVLLAQGELLSTHLFHYYCEEIAMPTCLLPALAFMKTQAGEPDEPYIAQAIQQVMTQAGESAIYITQGYICRNEEGQIDNLRRGGSDYTASLIGAAIGASEIQIWTDIDGLHNNDPRLVEKTFPIREISFAEAAELAYFGAKILHPSSVLPAQKANIPVRLLNTMAPQASGTIIHAQAQPSVNLARAVAAKDGIIAIKIRSSRMLLAYGFLKKIFEVFESYRTPIDMITTSEVAVSLTIDEASHLPEILQALRTYAEVEVDYDQTIICIVGNFSKDAAGVAVQVLASLKAIPLRMISSGGSERNISVLIESHYKQAALVALNEALFQASSIHS
ncbi:MAG: aspartate kinase [Bacteroidota bacterium]